MKIALRKLWIIVFVGTLSACAPGALDFNGSIPLPSGLFTPNVKEVVYTSHSPAEVRELMNVILRNEHPTYGVGRPSNPDSSAIYMGSATAAGHLRFHVLSNGLTRVELRFRDNYKSAQVKYRDALLQYEGFFAESGLPEYEPVPVSASLVRNGGDLFRYYSNAGSVNVAAVATQCGTDYDLFASYDYYYLPTPRVDVTLDGRTRLYLGLQRLSSDAPGRAIGEVQQFLGTVLACVDAQVGVGSSQ